MPGISFSVEKVPALFNTLNPQCRDLGSTKDFKKTRYMIQVQFPNTSPHAAPAPNAADPAGAAHQVAARSMWFCVEAVTLEEALEAIAGYGECHGLSGKDDNQFQTFSKEATLTQEVFLANMRENKDGTRSMTLDKLSHGRVVAGPRGAAKMDDAYRKQLQETAKHFRSSWRMREEQEEEKKKKRRQAALQAPFPNPAFHDGAAFPATPSHSSATPYMRDGWTDQARDDDDLSSVSDAGHDARGFSDGFPDDASLSDFSEDGRAR